MLAYDGAQALDVTGPLEVFALASRQAEEDAPGSGPLYVLRLVGIDIQPILLSSGLRLLPDMVYTDLREPVDTLLVAGAMGDALDKVRADRSLVAWLSDVAARVGCLASVCSGALLLAECGLLDGRIATTHWTDVRELRERYPRVNVQPDAIYTRDGNVWTSAGITAGMDLALAMVEADHGHALAYKVAKRMVLQARRSGGQSQLSPQLQAMDFPDLFADLDTWIQDNLHRRLDVPQLAHRVHMSPRQFTRRFGSTFGSTPHKYVEQLRVEAAKPLLQCSGKDVQRIASECGFGSAEAMRRAFIRHSGVSPSEYRTRSSVA
jgi:transcriptional regulator GlxA family with amidase domain